MVCPPASPANLQLTFDTPDAREFLGYWNSLPKIGLIPSRRDFDPAEVKHLLPKIVIHQVISAEMVKVRLAGTEVVFGYGRDITGENYLDFVAPERRAQAFRSIELLHTQPCGMKVRLIKTRRSGVAFLNETVALPMRNDAGVANLVYYVSADVFTPHLTDATTDHLERIGVEHRAFIDIGAGIPDFPC